MVYNIVNGFKEKINKLEDLEKVYDYIDNIDIVSNRTDSLLSERIFLKNNLYIWAAKQKNEICKSEYSDLNLTHLLKNRMFDNKKIYDILQKFPNVNRNLGKVPDSFLNNSENKKETSEKIFDILARYSFVLNSDYESNKTFTNKYMKLLQKEFGNIINKNVKISYVGHGVNGNGYKITIKENKKEISYFYKVFFPHNAYHSRINDFKHGPSIEPAYALFANNKARKNQFIKFYIGRIASPYERDAFMLTDFAENTKSEQNKLQIDYIKVTDSEIRRFDNKKDGKIVDFGGLKENNLQELKNPEIRKLVRVILNHITLNFNQTAIIYDWKISKNNLISLKNFINKYDKNLYNKAISIIKKEIPYIPQMLINRLKNIKSLPDKNITVKVSLSPSELLPENTEKLAKVIKKFRLKIKTQNSAAENMPGYIILDLFNSRQAVYRFNTDGIIHHFRLEKSEDGKITKLLELKDEKVKNSNINIEQLLN